MASLLHKALEATLREVAARGDVAARHRKIMAAVIMECAHYGFADAKIKDIAARAKVSTATIYRDYGDRDRLFVASLEMVVGLLSQVWRPADLPTDPLERLHALLLAQGNAWRDPDFGWIIRMYVFYGNSSAPHLLALGEAAQAGDVASWQAELDQWEEQGLINQDDRDTRLAIILGAIERRTIFARLGFGEQDDHKPAVEDVARHTSQAFFAMYGTDRFWATYGQDVGFQRIIAQVPPIEVPEAKMDAPSVRLKAYADKIMRADIDRLDAQARAVRIQLAAMLTCMQFGYENASMARVAETARVSTATLYLDYADKQTLFLDAMVMQARFRVDYSKFIDRAKSPADNVATIVFSIAKVLADPDFLWFHYVSMGSELSLLPALIDSSRQTRAHTEGFWLGYLKELISLGILVPHDTYISMNLLLGATQRGSVQSLVLFGRNDANEDELAALAIASTAFIFRLYGAKVS
jgi:AcrR family transcriptional regulator